MTDSRSVSLMHQTGNDGDTEPGLDVALENPPAADLDRSIDVGAAQVGDGPAELPAVMGVRRGDGLIAVDLMGGHRRTSGQRVIERCDEHQAVGEQLVVDQFIVRVGVIGAECEIHLVVDEALDLFAMQHGAHVDRVLGVAIAEPLDESRQDERRTGGTGREADGGWGSGRLVENQLEIVEDLVHSAHQGLGERVELLAGGSERNARGAAFEQDGHALVLELPHL